jgi:hypothetical protein
MQAEQPAMSNVVMISTLKRTSRTAPVMAVSLELAAGSACRATRPSPRCARLPRTGAITGSSPSAMPGILPRELRHAIRETLTRPLSQSSCGGGLLPQMTRHG